MSEEIKELIEKQIAEAKGFHDAVIHARNNLDLNSFALFMTEVTSRLLQIVQNQQTQIEKLQERVSDLEPQTAMGLLNEIVKRGQAGEFYKGGKEK